MQCWAWAETLPSGTASALVVTGNTGSMTIDYDSTAAAWRFRHNGNSTTATLTSTTALAAGQWVHFAGVIRSATSRSFWVNGSRVDDTSTNIGAIAGIGNLIQVGHSSNVNSWNGFLAECFGWMQYGLTDADVALLFRGNVLPEQIAPGRLMFQLPFDESVGQNITERRSGTRMISPGNLPNPVGYHPPIRRRQHANLNFSNLGIQLTQGDDLIVTRRHPLAA
jgi:hypothetical protein